DLEQVLVDHLARGPAEGRIADLDPELRRVELLAQALGSDVVLAAEALVDLGDREEVEAVPEALLDRDPAARASGAGLDLEHARAATALAAALDAGHPGGDPAQAERLDQVVGGRDLAFLGPHLLGVVRAD